MLDITFIRENSEIVKKACRDKQLDEKKVDELLKVDGKRKTLLLRVEELRAKSNQNAAEIKKQVQGGKKPDEKIVAAGKEIKTELKALENDLREMEEKWSDLQYQIPNVPAEDVPVGVDEGGNKVVRQVGEVPDFDFEPLDHFTLMQKLDLVDTKNAVRIGGFRSYFLKNEAVFLEQAVLNLALWMMKEHGFTSLTAPVLVRKEALLGTAYSPWGDQDHYQTQDGEVLAGTSEVALTAFHGEQTLLEKDLPVKMVGISPCFRREVGTYGKDMKGIVRVHQFNKIEQVVLTVADEKSTRLWHEKMVGYAEELLLKLKLPYQVLLMCTGDMGAGQRKKYDIETWFPAQQAYRETHSASYFNDFQARRLNMKYKGVDNKTKYVYTLNNTVAATPRLLAAIIENYQTADGHIRIPEVLQPMMCGKKII
ncbi:serine--tRNA ligase [Microgenomates group bacterium]|nr:serine--tRNA ligase [Microgenomates group bacterium]